MHETKHEVSFTILFELLHQLHIHAHKKCCIIEGYIICTCTQLTSAAVERILCLLVAFLATLCSSVSKLRSGGPILSSANSLKVVGPLSLSAS